MSGILVTLATMHVCCYVQLAVSSFIPFHKRLQLVYPFYYFYIIYFIHSTIFTLLQMMMGNMCTVVFKFLNILIGM